MAELHPDIAAAALSLVERLRLPVGETVTLTQAGYSDRRFVYAGSDQFVEVTPATISAEWRALDGGVDKG